MTGIQNSKPIFGLIGASVTAIVNIDTNQDGVIQFAETANAVQTIVIKALPVLGGVGELKNELSDLDEQEKAELVAELALELDLPNDDTEAIIERVVKIVLDVADLLIEIRQLNASDDPDNGKTDAVVG